LFAFLLYEYCFAAPAPSTDKIRPSAVEKPVSTGKPSPYEDIEISNIRAVIAKRLGESKVWHHKCI